MLHSSAVAGTRKRRVAARLRQGADSILIQPRLAADAERVGSTSPTILKYCHTQEPCDVLAALRQQLTPRLARKPPVHSRDSLTHADQQQRFQIQFMQSDRTVTSRRASGSRRLPQFRNFDATDQIARRAVDSGAIDRFGLIDPTDGGDSQRKRA